VAIGGLAADGEGIALLADGGTVVVSDEAVSAIREFRLADGALVGMLTVPSVYLAPNLRTNLGLESLGAHEGMLWTINEEALVSDGPVSTAGAGAWVRVQRFAADRTPAGQWAYRVDSISAMNPFTTLERSGAVEVLPISANAALILERELGGAVVPDFRSRIYFVDVGGATDVSSRASLADGGFAPLAKTLLWQGDFALQNFEGMALGPRLDDGCRSLLLVSDGNPGGSQGTTSLLALRICGLPASSADLDGSGAVDGADLAALLGAWGTPDPTADLDGDGVVGGGDLAMLLGAWS
jgi:3-phytase